MATKKTETTYAIINGGIVENIIVCDEAFAATLEADNDAVVLSNATPAYMGGEYKSRKFVAKPEPAVVPAV